LRKLGSDHVPLLSPEIVNYVAHTRECIVLDDARRDGKFIQTEYVIEQQPVSILCVPLLRHNRLTGLIYLENNLTSGAFTPDRVEVIEMLGTQATISITNARVIAARAEQERLRLENEFLEKQTDELAKLNADKDKFFSIVAHDLKGPFQPLLGFTTLIAEMGDQFGPEEIKEMGRNLHSSANNVFRLLENLLEWSTLQRGRMTYEPAKFNLLRVAEQNVTLLGENAKGKGIILSSRVPAGLFVHADENMIDTVIRNLTNNALKFTPEDGSVTISAVLAETTGPDAFAEVAIIDTGVGISDEDKGKLFRMDKHHTTLGTAKEQGTGLGLIICQEMVERNGGRIWVESKFGHGTAVKFTVPLDSSTVLGDLQIEESGSEPQSRKKIAKKNTMIVPPPEEMSVLHELAMIGDLGSIKARAEQIATMNEAYIPFTNKLKELVKDFEESEILTLIENVMT
jgi:signal transduction histidine kinase